MCEELANVPLPAPTRILAPSGFTPIFCWRYNLGMSTSTSRQPLTVRQQVYLRDDLASFEEKMLGIAILVHAAHGEDSQVVVRADEILCSLQRFKWELERVQKADAASA